MFVYYLTDTLYKTDKSVPNIYSLILNLLDSIFCEANVHNTLKHQLCAIKSFYTTITYSFKIELLCKGYKHT